MLAARERAFPEESRRSAAVAALRPALRAAAIDRLRDDACVAFPTETVWGLAARAESDLALARLRLWKGRGPGRPISLLVSGEQALDRKEFVVSELALRLMRRFWPGPLTLVLPTRRRLAAGVARADGAVGLRCSSHPLAAALADAAERAGLGFLTATSLNHSGRAAARCEREARLLCGADPGQPLVLGSGGLDAGGARPSSVLDLCGARPVLLRAGAVSSELLAPITGALTVPGKTDAAGQSNGGDKA